MATRVYESQAAITHPLVSWRSVIAGFLVTILTLSGLMALGLAIGGASLTADVSARGAGAFSGVWFLFSVLVSLFFGGYFAARISKFQIGRVGSAQGLVIASLFFVFFIYQMAMAVGWIGSTAGNAVGATASMISAGAGQAVDSALINETIEDTMSDLNIDPTRAQTIMSGVASRLIRGNVDGARNYLSRQTGISPTEANARIDRLRAQLDQAMINARETTARALQAMGFSLVVMLLLGTLAAVAGGALGSRTNVKKPLAREDLAETHLASI